MFASSCSFVGSLTSDMSHCTCNHSPTHFGEGNRSPFGTAYAAALPQGGKWSEVRTKHFIS